MRRIEDPGSRNRNAPPPGRSALSRLSRRIAAMAAPRDHEDGGAGDSVGRAARVVVIGSGLLAVWLGTKLDLTLLQSGQVFIGCVIVLAVAASLLQQAVRLMPALDEWSAGFLILAVALTGAMVHVLMH